jgi:Rod binding domain-containing protein
MTFPTASTLQGVEPARHLKPGYMSPTQTAAELDASTQLLHSAPGPSQLSQHDQLVKQTQNWVAQTFFATLLKQMRDSPFKSDLMDGGRGGQAFASLYDQQLAQRMSHAGGKKLVNSIVRKIEASAAYRKNAAKVSPGGGPDNHSQGGRRAGTSSSSSSSPPKFKESTGHVATARRA